MKDKKTILDLFQENGLSSGGKPVISTVSGKVIKYKVFYNAEKSKYYYFVNMDNFNTTIYKIVLKELPKPLGHYTRN